MAFAFDFQSVNRSKTRLSKNSIHFCFSFVRTFSFCLSCARWIVWIFNCVVCVPNHRRPGYIISYRRARKPIELKKNTQKRDTTTWSETIVSTASKNTITYSSYRWIHTVSVLCCVCVWCSCKSARSFKLQTQLLKWIKTKRCWCCVWVCKHECERAHAQALICHSGHIIKISGAPLQW